MKRLAVVSICLLSLLANGCDKTKSVSMGDVDLVQNHVMESIDKSKTVKQMIDNHKYFKNTKWELDTADKGIKAVQVKCYFDPSIKGESFQNAFLKFVFHINKDNEVSCAWWGYGADGYDGTKIEPTEKMSVYPSCIKRLEQIYKNVETPDGEISFMVALNYRLQTGKKLPSTKEPEPMTPPPPPPPLPPIAPAPQLSNIQAQDGKIYTHKDKKGTTVISNTPVSE